MSAHGTPAFACFQILIQRMISVKVSELERSGLAKVFLMFHRSLNLKLTDVAEANAAIWPPGIDTL